MDLDKHQVEWLNESLNDTLEVVILPQASQITGVPADIIGQLISPTIKKHLEILETGRGRILKNAYETAVTIVDIEQGYTFCVKQFNDRGLSHRIKGLFRKTHGLRTFYNGSNLLLNGVPVATPLVLIRKRTGGLVSVEWIIMEFMGNYIELDRYLIRKFEQGWSKEEQKSAVRQFGRFIGSMHSKGIFHSDLKTCNIMVSEKPGNSQDNCGSKSPQKETDSVSLRFCLLDYDDVNFSHYISMRKRVKNLAQIFLSTPLLVNRVERMRFLDEYSLHAGIGMSNRRKLAQDVLRKTQGRQILYVGVKGDVIEPVDFQSGK